MAALERLKADEHMYKAFATQQASTEKALERAYKAVSGMGSRE